MLLGGPWFGRVGWLSLASSLRRYSSPFARSHSLLDSPIPCILLSQIILVCYPPLVFAKLQSVLPARLTRRTASLRNLRVRRLLRLGRGVGACPELLGALDFSSLGLTLNLQLSTFNRVSFLSSHLSLSQCSSKSFTIRTSETPLPQLLYNPHLQAPLGSAGNKRLITPLESALTKNSPVSL